MNRHIGVVNLSSALLSEADLLVRNLLMTTSKPASPFAGYRFPAEIITHVVWLYFRFPLSLRMVDEILAARGIVISHETVRQWARKFGRLFARSLRRRQPKAGDQVAPRRDGDRDQGAEILALARR